MKTIAAVLLFCACAAAFAKEVVSSGYGTTLEAATLNAKKEATAQVVGSFIVGRTDINNNDMNNRITEYSGGVVRKYEVLEAANENGLFHVTIKADVDEDKVNTVILSSGKDIPSTLGEQLNRQREDRENAKQTVQALDSTKDAFAVTVKKIQFENHGDSTTVAVKYKVEWSPKWRDDLETLAKKINRKNMSGDFIACFAYSLGSSETCYDMQAEMTKVFKTPVATLVIETDNGNITKPVVMMGQFALFEKGNHYVRVYESSEYEDVFVFNTDTDTVAKAKNIRIEFQ